MHHTQVDIQYPDIRIEKSLQARPFLKWAGGKGQILFELENRFPTELLEGKITKYFEPFAGGAAVFFLIASRYRGGLEYLYLNDINSSLIVVYKVIQNNVDSLCSELFSISDMYNSLSKVEKENYYYEQRIRYNQIKRRLNRSILSKSWISAAAKMIFLNKTCFNGLYRENRAGDFNVPYGRYKNPSIFDEDALIAASKVLRGVEIESTNFPSFEEKVTENSFVYFDPPYRPISKTSSFTSYSSTEFGESEQLELARLFRDLNKKGAKLLLSNSDPKNENPYDDFFERHYKGFNIERVSANRMINCDATKRGAVRELIITNY